VLPGGRASERGEREIEAVGRDWESGLGDAGGERGGERESGVGERHGMGGHGTESLASSRASPAGLQRPARQKLFAESVTNMPALVCSTSERTVELVRQQKRTAGVASVAKAMAPASEFGFRALIPTEAEFR
jgi:hypothetical protein